jgi:hypothetical protein
MEGLLSWLADDYFEKIVMVKNCTTAIDVSILKELAEEHGKDFEFLNAPASPMAAIRGKGYILNVRPNLRPLRPEMRPEE